MMHRRPRLARNPGEPPRSRLRNRPYARASPFPPYHRCDGHAAGGERAAAPAGHGRAMRRPGGPPMSALDSLIRLHRWQVDERRRHLADLDGLATQLAEESQRLDREEAREQATAAASPEAAITYAAYARQLVERRRKLAQSQAEVAGQI